MKVPYPAINILGILPKTLSFTNVLIASVNWDPKVLASDGRSVVFAANENPLPNKSMNMRFVIVVNLLGFGDNVISLFKLTGPIPLKL